MPIGPPFRPSTPRTSYRVGMLSTYPPKLCGLATFAAALEQQLQRAGHVVDMVRIDDGDQPPTVGRPVAGELVNGEPGSIRKVVALLSRCDIVIVQHEYGIFGGADGDEVLELLRTLTVPAVVVLHTVPLQPTPHQHSVLVDVVALADRVVVMTETARDRLTGLYPVDPTKVTMIPHGASSPTPEPRDEIHLAPGRRPQLLTWGLLGPGKGIEHAIDALALLGDLHDRPRYTVAGVTHPKVFTMHGDAYRQSLVKRSWAAGVAGSITFDDTYRDLPELMRFVASASAVILPYDSRDQVTSGVLVDAIAAGRPVIATAFPHAVELLSTGAGIVVPHGDPVALADAIRSVVADPDLLASMAAEARRLAPALSWAAVAGRYVEVADELVQTNESVAI